MSRAPGTTRDGAGIARLSRLAARCRRDQRGAVAVEFAVIFPAFASIIFAIVELGWVLLKIYMVDDAVMQASRFVYTGQATTGSVTQGDIEQFICDNAVIIMDCGENVAVEAFVLSDFSVTAPGDVTCRNSSLGPIAPATTYVSGASGQIVYLRACVTTDLFFPFDLIGLDLSHDETGRFQIVSSTAFVNEPF